MKKRMFYLLLIIVSTFTLLGCNSFELHDKTEEDGFNAISENPNTESMENVSENSTEANSQNNTLETIFLSDDHFELKQDSITIEYGTQLSDDISEYVIAKDYSNITYEYEESSPTDALVNMVPGTITFTRNYDEQLIMTVNYVDTIPPTIEKTEYTYCTIKLSGRASKDELLLYEDMAPRGVQNQSYQIFDIKEYFGITDNSQCIPSALVIDGISYELDETIPSQTLIPALDYGNHNIIITVYDTVGHTQTFECILHVVKDISPEERELMLSEGYTEEQINVALEEFLTNN